MARQFLNNDSVKTSEKITGSTLFGSLSGFLLSGIYESGVLTSGNRRIPIELDGKYEGCKVFVKGEIGDGGSLEPKSVIGFTLEGARVD